MRLRPGHILHVILIVATPLVFGSRQSTWAQAVTREKTTATQPERTVVIGSGMMEARLINKVTPQYPALARNAHVCGTITLRVIIGRDGVIEGLTYVAGPPILLKSAMDAVSQWRYSPVNLAGIPVKVDTTVRVVYTLDGVQGCADEASKPESRPAAAVIGGVIAAQYESVLAPAARSASSTTPFTPEHLGSYYALVIGINDYAELPKLKTAVKDAEDVAALLKRQYGFQTKLLSNATRQQITSALSEYRRTLAENSNLLIYYAGHGIYDREADRAYWLPANAQLEDNTNWIIADEITTDARAIPSRHVLIISDSCYSGAMTREFAGGFTPEQRDRYLEKMLQGKSRTLMSSGGVEPVSDEGGQGHSVFADALIRALSATEENVFAAQDLFEGSVRISVAGKSDQTPQYTPIRNSGHDSGDFVFLRR